MHLIKKVKNQKKTFLPGIFTSEMASLSNSSWQNHKERPNRSTNNGDMDKKAKRHVDEGLSL